ncbi:MAG: DNA-binding protein [Desulfobacterales bacterium]|nr:DNA-binding protein [Desulfobacterales bacterium]
MRKYISLGCGLMLLLTTSIACNRQDAETTTQSTPAPEASAPASTETPAPAASPLTVKKGTVVEAMNAAGYTYMLVDDGTEKKWVAITESQVKAGDKVSYYDGIVMENFHSKTLNRNFDSVVFSSGLVGQAPMGMGNGRAAGAPMMSGAKSFNQALQQESGMMPSVPAASMGSKKAVVPFIEIKVAKAAGDNSYTVGEIFEKAAELDGKQVTVRGKLVKVSANIMGLNWLHIQDGTGHPEQRTHDLVVTTSAQPEENWDIITVHGTVSADKDFGAGYFYPVIIENASVSR